MELNLHALLYTFMMYCFHCVNDSSYTAYPCTVLISCHKVDAGLFVYLYIYIFIYLLFGEQCPVG